eukprot:3492331-Pyramimonas_sp.AAC.1
MPTVVSHRGFPERTDKNRCGTQSTTITTAHGASEHILVKYMFCSIRGRYICQCPRAGWTTEGGVIASAS